MMCVETDSERPILWKRKSHNTFRHFESTGQTAKPKNQKKWENGEMRKKKRKVFNNEAKLSVQIVI